VRQQDDDDMRPVCSKHRIYFQKLSEFCVICNYDELVKDHNAALAASRVAEPLLSGNNSSWPGGGIESFSEGEEEPDEEVRGRVAEGPGVPIVRLTAEQVRNALQPVLDRGQVPWQNYADAINAALRAAQGEKL
jgi:hypothetical protein